MKKEDVTIEFDEVAELPNNSATVYHYGSLNYKGKDYHFTLCEMYDGNADHSEFDLTFVDEEPQGDEGELTEFIVEKLDEEIEKREQEVIENEKAWKRSQN